MGVSTAISDLDTVHKTEYFVGDLSTSSVTLFPSRAQVYRELKGVQLKRGTNEVTIVGLSQTVDSDSIKVESNGTATITNLEVYSVTNRRHFDDVHPEPESESESESDDQESADDEARTEDPELVSARDALEELKDRLATVVDDGANAQKRLDLLEELIDLNERENPDFKATLEEYNDFIQATLQQYKEQRSKAFQEGMQTNCLQRELNKDLEKAEKKVRKLQRAQVKRNAKEDKARARARKEKEKKKALKDRLKAEAKRERQRLRQEQQQFWPSVVYSVRITLEVAAMTPMTSRRGSTSSDADIVQIPSAAPAEGDEVVDPVECNLNFSYVTSSAYWTPSYDLQLSSTSASASLYFDAMLTNRTSESWKSCKVTLSTSQATFSGPYDTIPELNPWRIKLAFRNHLLTANDDITRSAEEVSYATKNFKQASMLLHQDNTRRKEMTAPPPPHAPTEAPRTGGLFGPGVERPAAGGLFGAAGGSQAPSGGLFGSAASNNTAFGSSGGGLFGFAASSNTAFGSSGGGTTTGGGLFGFAGRGPAAASGFGRGFGGGVGGLFANTVVSSAAPAAASPSAEQQQQARQQQAQPALQSQDVLNDFDFDAFLNDGAQPDDSYDASLVEETGLTTTYDLPGLKTLVPKNNGSKQRVARIAFSNVVFSHTVVPKYKPVAYLKAKLTNSSKMALLKGGASLTLDGTFMGKTSLPRCSSGESFSLSLGVDPAINVMYPKPEVQRTSAGLFGNQDSSVYLRTVTLHNTRAVGGKAVNLVVLDQVPVSEDEKLRVDVSYPRGLTVDGAGVPTGEAGKEGKDEDWGTAEVKLKKEGLVSWDVSLNAGKTVKLSLEYVVSMPSGETAQQV